MPQASDELRNKFFEYDNKGHIIKDGIAKASKIIIECGCEITEEYVIIVIELNEYSQHFWDAVTFLCSEWDYSMSIKGKNHCR